MRITDKIPSLCTLILYLPLGFCLFFVFCGLFAIMHVQPCRSRLELLGVSPFLLHVQLSLSVCLRQIPVLEATFVTVCNNATKFLVNRLSNQLAPPPLPLTHTHTLTHQGDVLCYRQIVHWSSERNLFVGYHENKNNILTDESRQMVSAYSQPSDCCLLSDCCFKKVFSQKICPCFALSN